MRWRWIVHRFAHWLHREGCELLTVCDDGTLVLRCMTCGEIVILEGR